MKVAIVGCGLVGQKRAKLLGEHRLVACADASLDRAKALAASHGQPEALATADYREAVTRPEVEAVLVSTPHNLLAPIALAAVEAGKHVLLEKPGARRAAELDAVVLAARKNKVRVRVGFNHRYHPALLKARELVEEGDLGPLHLIRGRYGHGGRIGYDKEWRANPELSGGGQLIDQGVHLIDLARMFLGDFPVVQSSIATYFWDMPVEDNAFLMMRSNAGATAFLHTSCTEWKNLFSFEIFGKVGKLDIAGLGGSYGTERITFYRMLPELGPPETTAWEYPMEDHSWSREWDAFVQDILLGREPSPGLADAQAARASSNESIKTGMANHHPQAKYHDHHTQPLAHHAGRRGHRSALLLPGAWRVPHCRRDPEIRLHHAAPDVRSRVDHQVLEDGAGL